VWVVSIELLHLFLVYIVDLLIECDLPPHAILSWQFGCTAGGHSETSLMCCNLYAIQMLCNFWVLWHKATQWWLSWNLCTRFVLRAICFLKSALSSDLRGLFDYTRQCCRWTLVWNCGSTASYHSSYCLVMYKVLNVFYLIDDIWPFFTLLQFFKTIIHCGYIWPTENGKSVFLPYSSSIFHCGNIWPTIDQCKLSMSMSFKFVKFVIPW